MAQQNKLKDSLLSFFHNLFDLIVVNWLWLLCCLPVITIGPATCAMYHVTLRLARGEPVSLLSDFFGALKSNFKAGLILSLVCGLLLAAAAGDAWFSTLNEGWIQTLYLVIAIIIGVAGMIILAYAFALQAMFDSPVKIQLLNAFKLAAVAPGKTILLWLILLIPVIAALVLPLVALQMLGFLYLVAGFSGPAYGASRILRNIFDRVNGAPVVAEPPTTED